MIGRLILFVLSVVFGILAYTHSEDVITNRFVVTEKVKTGDHLYLKYKKNNLQPFPHKEEAIFEVTPEQYIEANKNKIFVVREEQKMYWVYLILCIVCVIILFASVGDVDISDLLELIH